MPSAKQNSTRARYLTDPDLIAQRERNAAERKNKRRVRELRAKGVANLTREELTELRSLDKRGPALLAREFRF